MCDALDQYGGVDSGNDDLVLLSTDEGDDGASVASSQLDYHVNIAWQDQVYDTLGAVKEEVEN